MPAPNGFSVPAGRVALADIDAVVSARLGPARVTGNAQPAAFNRQVAMYLAKHMGWSTTKIGKFYNGRDHSTVCHSIRRIEILREQDSEVDGLIMLLTQEVRESASNAPVAIPVAPGVPLTWDMLDDEFVNRFADRVALRLLRVIGEGTAKNMKQSVAKTEDDRLTNSAT
jgi:hypothetical protein